MTGPVEIVAIGNAIVDVLSMVTDDVIQANGLAKGTMRLIESEESARLYESMGPGTEVSGGSIANTAAGLAMLGTASAFIGKVGDDQLGDVFTHDIRAAGVAFDTPPASGAVTGHCLIMVTPDAQRTMNTHLGVAGELSPADIDSSLLEGARYTVLEGFLWDPPTARAALMMAAQAAQTVVFSLSDRLLVERHREAMAGFCADDVDVLFGNEDELMTLCRTDNAADTIKVAKDLCPLVVMTRSEKGSVVVASSQVTEVPAVTVSDLVDTTGAGDLFAAGFLAGLCRGLDHRQCAELGGAAAAAVITQVGARLPRGGWVGMPTPENIHG